MLGQRRRRWSNVTAALIQCLVFAGLFMSYWLLDTTFIHSKDNDPMLVHCWDSVVDGGPTLIRHWVNVLCLLHMRYFIFHAPISLLLSGLPDGVLKKYSYPTFNTRHCIYDYPHLSAVVECKTTIILTFCLSSINNFFLFRCLSDAPF